MQAGVDAGARIPVGQRAVAVPGVGGVGVAVAVDVGASVAVVGDQHPAVAVVAVEGHVVGVAGVLHPEHAVGVARERGHGGLQVVVHAVQAHRRQAVQAAGHKGRLQVGVQLHGVAAQAALVHPGHDLAVAQAVFGQAFTHPVAVQVGSVQPQRLAGQGAGVPENGAVHAQHVVAVAAVQRAAAVGAERVVARAAQQRVGTAAAAQGVVAVAAVQGVDARVAHQQVGRGAAGGVEVGRAGEGDVLQLRAQHAGADAGLHGVRAFAGQLGEGVVGVADDVGVVTRAAHQRVGAGAAHQGVVAGATVQRVASRVGLRRFAVAQVGGGHGTEGGVAGLQPRQQGRCTARTFLGSHLNGVAPRGQVQRQRVEDEVVGTVVAQHLAVDEELQVVVRSQAELVDAAGGDVQVSRPAHREVVNVDHAGRG